MTMSGLRSVIEVAAGGGCWLLLVVFVVGAVSVTCF
jgi:hypothetical protein